MKKIITYTSRAALTLLLLIAGLSKASAGATWIGNSYVYMNGSWYTCSGGSGAWTSGAFNEHDFGTVTSLTMTIGGQIQIYDPNSTSWTGNGDWMHYTIDKDDDAWVDLNMSKSGTSGNNMDFQTGGASFATTVIDLSGLTAGEHTISVYFGNIDDNYDSNGGNNYVATFTIPETQTVSVGTYGMATYCPSFALDFTGVEDIKAYTITNHNSATGLLTKTQVTGKVKAGTGLYIEGAANASADVPVAVYTTSVASNMLVGVNTDTQIFQIDGSNTNYILTVNKDGGNVGTPKFFKVYDDGDETPNEPADDGNTVLAGKAYLQIPTASAARESFWFDGDVTAIEKLTPAISEGVVYDLQGRKVMYPAKGLYIVNGKKVIK